MTWQPDSPVPSPDEVLAHLDPGPGEPAEGYISADDVKAALSGLMSQRVQDVGSLQELVAAILAGVSVDAWDPAQQYGPDALVLYQGKLWLNTTGRDIAANSEPGQDPDWLEATLPALGGQPAPAGGAAEYLGTWTPELRVGNKQVPLDDANGQWHVVGRHVTLRGYVLVGDPTPANLQPTDPLIIGGLPCRSEGGYPNWPDILTCPNWYKVLGGLTPWGLYDAGGYTVDLNRSPGDTSDSNPVRLTMADIGSGSELYFSLSFTLEDGMDPATIPGLVP